MNILTTTAYCRSLKHYDDATLQVVGKAMNLAAAVFGQPHLHSGRGIRDLGKHMYECRTGLSLRLLFTRTGDTLIFEFAGTHAEVLAWLKNRR